ncbi:membrane protein [Salmonella enterica]|nr:membrane protein [Salmonella enterica]
MTLFAEYNSPYLFAIAFVFFIGVLEMISLIFGHFLSGALDAHLDHYDALSSGPAGQALHYLNIGRVPALVVLCLLAGYFGLFGILIQHGGIMLWQAPLSNLLLVPLSIVLSVFAVHYSGKILAPWLPRDESSALREEEFIGGMAIITGHAAVAGTPCEGNLPISSARFTIYCWNPKREKNLKKETRY